MPTLDDFLRALGGQESSEIRALLLAWARALPLVTIVPAFGLGAVALPIRIGLALGMALAVAPALRPVLADGVPLFAALLREAALGLPLALATSAFLWAAIMAGGLVDNLRGARENVEGPFLDEPTTPLAALLGLFAGLAFLETGGAARVASALAEPRLVTGLGAAVERISDAMGVAVALAAPLVAGSIVVEVALGLVARAASPAYVFPLLLPLRSLSLLVLLWIALDRVVELLVLLAARA